MALSPGQRLLHYEIIALLGSGGAGEVYRARDTKLSREVAIKVLPDRLARDPERLQRLTIEAQALASLSHANLAHVYGIEQVDGQTFIVMELVPGETLAARLKHGPIPIKEALDLGRQIAAGLEEAHEQGVVHRDLKPENVLVTEEGHAKVLDFGFAKLNPITGDGLTAGLVTEEGVLHGTPLYMSPEHIGGGKVDRRTDIWALGCVLYECLAGRRPFRGKAFHEVSMEILGEEPVWTALPPQTPRHVRQLLERMLQKDPRIRLRDMGEVRVALTPGLQPWVTEADSTPTRKAGEAPDRSSRPVWVVSAVVVAAVLGAVFTRLLGSEPHTPPVVEAHFEATPAEAKFRPPGAVLTEIEEAVREGLVPSIGGFVLLDRVPREFAEVRVYHDTSALHLRNAHSGFTHTFTVEGSGAASGWSFFHCPHPGELRRRVLSEEVVPDVAVGMPVGTTILDRVGRQDFGPSIRMELAADLGRGLDLHPRVLLVVTSKRWQYEQSGSERRIGLEVSSIAAMWWIPGTAEFLDGAFSGIEEIPLVGIDATWTEREIEIWRELSIDSGDSGAEISELPDLSEFQARFELEEFIAGLPRYHFAVDKLTSKAE